MNIIETTDAADPAGSTCLVLMFKSPARSKRRLAREIGAFATGAAARLFDCAVEDLETWPGPVRFAPAEPEDAHWLESHLGAGQPVVMQGPGNLGERIATVAAALVEDGLGRHILIGIDCPTLRQDHLVRAARALADHDAVLAPAVDGGAALIGTRRRWPPLHDLPWSEPALLDALVARLTERGWRLRLTDTLADVDTAADLRAVTPALAGDGRPARRELRDWVDTHADDLARTVP